MKKLIWVAGIASTLIFIVMVVLKVNGFWRKQETVQPVGSVWADSIRDKDYSTLEGVSEYNFNGIDEYNMKGIQALSDTIKGYSMESTTAESDGSTSYYMAFTLRKLAVQYGYENLFDGNAYSDIEEEYKTSELDESGYREKVESLLERQLKETLHTYSGETVIYVTLTERNGMITNTEDVIKSMLLETGISQTMKNYTSFYKKCISYKIK